MLDTKESLTEFTKWFESEDKNTMDVERFNISDCINFAENNLNLEIKNKSDQF